MGAERTAPQLIESVCADPHRQEEGGEGGQQPVGVHLGRGRRSERHVAEMPGGIGRVQQGDEIAPGAGPQGVEGRTA